MPPSRSPSYPNISLVDAISKARQIYQKENMSTMTPEVAAEAMGYTGINGASLKTIAALKKWGLLDGRADGLRLTADAQSLSIDDPSSADYHAALARCAASPEIFGEINKQFPSGASERNIAVFLQKNGFQPDAASTVAKHFKDTLALISGGGTPFSSGEDQPESATHIQVESRPRPVSVPRNYGGEALSPSAGPIGEAAAPFRITMNGTKLHIEADVDLAGLQTLKQMLEGYEKILKLLATPVGQIARPEWADKTYAPGETVPVDGMWDVTHHGHLGDGPKEFHKGERFTSCGECADRSAVRYTYRDPLI